MSEEQLENQTKIDAELQELHLEIFYLKLNLKRFSILSRDYWIFQYHIINLKWHPITLQYYRRVNAGYYV